MQSHNYALFLFKSKKKKNVIIFYIFHAFEFNFFERLETYHSTFPLPYISLDSSIV